MTDTTDIKALREEVERLREELLVERNSAINLSNHLSDCAGKLRAERQRSAGSEEELHKALHREKAVERKLLAAQEEIAELKGEQVPASAEFFADGKWWPFSNAEHKANTIAAGYPVRELFTAAPKPVMVMPDLWELNNPGEGSYYMSHEPTGWRKDMVIARYVKIEAGGIVKCGE